MKIDRFEGNVARSGDGRKALLRIVDQPEALEKRPCVTCVRTCSCEKRSTHCACMCSPECSEAPRLLSTEPDRYPVEDRVVPLVYELAVLSVTQPCWSCEGHYNDRNELIRAPQVWFYAERPVYAELIAEHLAALRRDDRLSEVWDVSIGIFSEDMSTTTFVVRPRVSDRNVHLGRLQADLRVIAEELRAKLKKLAESRLRIL